MLRSSLATMLLYVCTQGLAPKVQPSRPWILLLRPHSCAASDKVPLRQMRKTNHHKQRAAHRARYSMQHAIADLLARW